VEVGTGAAEAYLSAVSKALTVLESFSARGSAQGLREISRNTGIPKTSVLRALVALEGAGYVTKDGTRYRLTRRVMEVATASPGLEPGGLRDAAMPHLSELHQASGLSVNLAVLEGREVFYLTRIHRATGGPLPGRIGGRLPASCTALGKVLLAYQPDEFLAGLLAHPLPAMTQYSVTSVRVLQGQLEVIRNSGLAYDREESAVGLLCAAAPVLFRGNAVAAVSVSGRGSRLSARPLDGLLRKAAAATASDFVRVSAQRLDERLD
jgi:IclR family transcriptional regulator, acetate operon repressor